MNFFEAEAAAKQHVQQECPMQDSRKRIIDLVRTDGKWGYTFHCRGCNWAINEEKQPWPY